MVMLAALAGCAPKAPPAAAVPEPAPASAWEAPLGHDHPLIGRIWSRSAGAFVDEAALVADLEAADHALLGEKHDNPDVHRVQARLISALAPKAVGFEMLDRADPVAEATDAGSLAQVVGWSESGWPDFALYAPVFEATYAAGATVIAAHPTKEDVRTAMTAGADTLPPELVEGLRLERTLPPEEQAELEAEIVRSHCGHARPEVVQMMVGAQVFKDAWMARALERSGPKTVLVAGNGHVRTDRGVPHYLDGEVRAVSIVEVQADVTDPAEVDEEADYVWFVPRLDDEDPCAAFAEQLKQMSTPAP